MLQDVKNFVHQCDSYQYNKYSTHKPIGALQPLSIPQQVWEDLSMDFITHLPNFGCKTVIWVVVNRLSKYAYFMVLLSRFTASSLATVFAVEIFCLHCIPKTIVNDRDPLFLTKFWQERFCLSGTTLAYSSAYHPK
ncbi:UNVERIFIED_CONTAM: hypothetical protein Slati_2158800 [Sesamum latifolium]|uniref:Integrase catalytic domain-containing protein n=1 Tax=Sesamum latifolium TaxID=2727402 RepID=A0AAW2WUF6_9LAMI